MTMLPYSSDNWCAFFEAVGHPECIEEFAVRDRVERGRNIDRIYDKMSEIAIQRTTAEWEALLLELDVPHAAFTLIEEVAAQPHLKAVEMFEELDHPTEGTLVQARPHNLGLRRLQGHASLHSGQLRIRLRHIAGAPKADRLRKLS